MVEFRFREFFTYVDNLDGRSSPAETFGQNWKSCATVEGEQVSQNLLNSRREANSAHGANNLLVAATRSPRLLVIDFPRWQRVFVVFANWRHKKHFVPMTMARQASCTPAQRRIGGARRV